MNDRVSEIFGYIVMAAAAVLFVWERVAYNKRNLEDAWLLTRRRYVRRSAVSAALAMIGILLVLESVNLLDISLVVPLTLYVLALCGLAILLLILAMVDLADTTSDLLRKIRQPAVTNSADCLSSHARSF